MNSLDPNDRDVLLVKIATMALVVFALIQLPRVIGAFITVFSGLANRFFDASAIIQRPLDSSLSRIAYFVVLLFLINWLSKYPPIIRKLLSNSNPKGDQPLP